MGDAVPLDEEPRQLQEENEEQCDDVFLFISQLVRLNDPPPDNGQDTPYENEETEELEEEIKEGSDRTRFKGMGKGESRDPLTPFHKITRGESLDHVHSKGSDKPEDKQGVRQPAVERLTEKLPVKEDVHDEDSEIPSRSSPEAPPAPQQEDSKVLQRSGILFPLYLSSKVKAESKTHPPKKDDEGRDEHGVEDEMFIHS